MEKSKTPADIEEVIAKWKADGASVEFLEFVREVFGPFVKRLHIDRTEDRNTSAVCDAVVELVGLMVIDLAGTMVGIDSNQKTGQYTLEFYNRFMSELANHLSHVLRESFGIYTVLTQDISQTRH